MAEELQLSSIQQRIAALKRSQAGGESPHLSYNGNGSALSGALIQKAPRPTQTPSAQPEVRAKKTPPPLPTRRADRPPPPLPARPERLQPPSHSGVRPTLPPRRPTDPSLSSNDRIKAPAWGKTELPVLPPKRSQDDLKPLPRSESSSNSMVSGLTSKISALRGRVPRSSSPSSSARFSLPSHPPSGDSSPRPQIPSHRPQTQQNETNGDAEEYRPSLPIRRLPPPSTADSIQDARQAGFVGFNKSPGSPPRPGSTPSVNGASSGGPPPVPHGSRPSAYSPPETSGRGKVSNIDK